MIMIRIMIVVVVVLAVVVHAVIAVVRIVLLIPTYYGTERFSYSYFGQGTWYNTETRLRSCQTKHRVNSTQLNSTQLKTVTVTPLIPTGDQVSLLYTTEEMKKGKR
mmetsp:Transcript_7834/g.11966  ORF Transcript_7834/g.11966 Transcript_7834/m.11966 type:complete len:106 (-) Transcript_7834:9-326(-)